MNHSDYLNEIAQFADRLDLGESDLSELVPDRVYAIRYLRYLIGRLEAAERIAKDCVQKNYMQRSEE
jgi:hypothetical protein